MITYRHSLALALIFSFFISTQGQTTSQQPSHQTPAPAQQQVAEEDVVRITTNLVQVDAVVTDSQGRQVTDLNADDFEIREDNREQKITNFSYVSTDSAQPNQTTLARTPSRNAPPVPPVQLRPEQVRRTIALVIDDFGLSIGSMHFVKGALKKFVDEQIQPNDLVAIVTTSGSIGGLLQQFTSDRRILYAAIDRMRWNPRSRGQAESSAPGMPDAMQSTLDTLGRFRDELYTVGTLGALDYVVRGMRDLPGRKSVLLISDGFKIWLTHPPTTLQMDNPYVGPEPAITVERIVDNLRRLTDLANRSSVVIYTMNAAGLRTYNDDASTDLSGIHLSQGDSHGGDQFAERFINARTDAFDSQTGLTYLAHQTGGFAVQNTNDLVGGIKRVLDDQKGYYLIAYHPAESTFAQGSGYKRFHKIIVKVKRPGLRVRSRTGFFGVTDEVASPVPHTRNEQLISALKSPFKATGVDLRMTSLFANDAQAGSFMRSLLHIAAHDLTFTDDGEGWHKSTFDVLAITFGESGRVVDEMGLTHNIRVSDRTYRRIMQQGFDYMITVPVKKPGAYQLRVSLRDTASERLGSVSEFIEVPDITKNRLMLSGIIMSGSEAASARPAAAATGAQSQVNENAQNPAQVLTQQSETEVRSADTQAGPVLRQLRQGMTLQYVYVIYNAQLERATQKPKLTTQMRLYRDGQQVFAGNVQPLDTTGQPDLKRVTVGGGLVIGSELPPGEYVLQVIVTDLLAKANHNTATQWIDFEIIR
ncbi:MAG: hypothetical protein AUG51_16325 [Acidobacteria bacterium 13_1_20CM_3_53_8]|nr:MAG: hypothetical protein AUG51_16325 [Acidobacteria bacterium 13_1_20CM_3_53_8]